MRMNGLFTHKKWLTRLAAIVCCLAAATAVHAANITVDGINYTTKSDGTATVAKYTIVKATATSKSCGARGVYCSAKLAVSSGPLTAAATSKESYSRGIECKKLSVRSGKVRAFANAKFNWSAEGLTCPSKSVRGKGSVVAKGNGTVQYERTR